MQHTKKKLMAKSTYVSDDNDSDCSWISVTKHAHDCQCNICAELEPFALYQVFKDDLED